MLRESKCRILQPEQWDSVKTCLKSRPIYPLHIKLLLDLVSKWRHNDKADDKFYSCIGIKETIKYWTGRLVQWFDKQFVLHSFFYLRIFRQGISETEIEKIMNNDKKCVDSIYWSNHKPKEPRFLMSLWLQLKFEIKDYLTTKISENTEGYTW